MRTFPFPWKNKSESEETPLEAKEIKKAEENLLGTALLVVNADQHLMLDGTTDDGPALNALMAELVPSNQQEVVIAVPYGRTLALGTTVKRQPFVSLRGEGGHIKVLPALKAGPVFTNTVTEKLVRSDIIGFTIEKGELEGTLFDCHSMQNSKIEVKRMVGGTELCTNLSMKADGTISVDGDVKSNSAFNTIEIIDSGLCAYNVSLAGQEVTAIPAGSGPAVVTLNEFCNITARNIYKGGIQFKEWCDTNHFTGITSCSVKGEGAYAAMWNDSATPAANVGVYNDNIDMLTFEAYGTAKKRKGIVFGWTKQNIISEYFPEPVGPEGVEFENKNSQSHIVNQVHEGSNVMRLRETPRDIQEVATPGTPGAGFAKLFFAEKKLKFIDSEGTVHVVNTTP